MFFLLLLLLSLKRHRSIFSGNLTTDQYVCWMPSLSFFFFLSLFFSLMSFFPRSFYFDWNVLAWSCCGRYVQIKPSNTIVDRSAKMHWMWKVQEKKPNRKAKKNKSEKGGKKATKVFRTSTAAEEWKKFWCVQSRNIVCKLSWPKKCDHWSESLTHLLRLTLIGSI